MREPPRWAGVARAAYAVDAASAPRPAGAYANDAIGAEGAYGREAGAGDGRYVRLYRWDWAPVGAAGAVGLDPAVTAVGAMTG